MNAALLAHLTSTPHAHSSDLVAVCVALLIGLGFALLRRAR